MTTFTFNVSNDTTTCFISKNRCRGQLRSLLAVTGKTGFRQLRAEEGGEWVGNVVQQGWGPSIPSLHACALSANSVSG